MSLITYKQILWIFILLSTPIAVFSQASRYHYIPPIAASETIAGRGNSVADDMSAQYFYITTASTESVTYTIYPLPISPATSFTGVISKLSPAELRVNNINRYLVDNAGYGQLFITASQSGTPMSNKGYYIEADAPIYVNLRYRASAQGSGLVSKGEAALGKSFRNGGFTNGRPVSHYYLNFASVMAVETGTTTVTFSDIFSMIPEASGYPDIENIIETYDGAGNINDIVVELDQFETFVVAMKAAKWDVVEDPPTGNLADQGYPYPIANRDALVGMSIESSKNIAVISGGANGSMTETQNGRDHGIDQIVGLDKAGTEFIFIKGNPTAGQEDYDNAIIVAHEDNTEVFLNGETTATVTLAAGEYHSIEGDEYSGNGNIYVRTSRRAYAYQAISNGSSANTDLWFVPPLSCTSIETIETIPNIRDAAGQNWNTFLTIVAPATASVTISDARTPTPTWTGNFTDNNVTINNIAGAATGTEKSFGRTVIGNPNYTTYKIQGLISNVSVFSNYPDGSKAELYAAYYNSSGSATAGAFYSGFPSPPDSSFNEAGATGLNDCIPYVSLSLTNFSDFDSVEWEYWNGEGAVNYNTVAGWDTQTVTPTQVGFYKAIGVITCSGSDPYRLESNPKKVSNCPVDTDSDGIYDNIDVDIDNDGIYNTVESRLVSSLNLSDINDPTLVFPDLSTNNSIPSSTFTRSNPGTVNMTGQTSGAFQLTVPPGESGAYKLSFTEPVNIKLFEDINFAHTFITGDTYKVSIFPTSLTLTMLDPGDELKVDTNQNNVYDSGVVTYTSSEILFTFDGAADNSNRFSFQADGVREITLTQVGAPTASGNVVFNGVFSIEYLNTDTDSDTISNAYDHDSDEDACFDTREAGFTDGDSNGYLGTDPVTVENELSAEPGRVNNQGEGYTTPRDGNSNGVRDFLEFSEAPSFSLEPLDVLVCNGDNTSFTVSSTQTNLNYQWQKLNTTSGNWENLVNNALYSGVTSNILNLTSPPFAMDNSLFRAAITKDEYVCATFSTSVTLDLSDPGITPSGMPLVLDEGVSNDTFTIVLSDTPSDTVQINFTVSPTGHYVVSQDFVVFNNSNWNTPQSINLDAIDEPLVDGTVTATLVLDFDPSSDDCFIPLGTSTYSVTIFNNDIPGWDVSQVIRTVEDEATTGEGGVDLPTDSESTTISTGKRGIVDPAFVTENDPATAEFSIVLTAQPVNDVFVDIINNDSTEKTLSDTSLTFTNSNWNVSQTIIINSVDDSLIDGDQNTSITARINAASDPAFLSLPPEDRQVLTIDDDLGDFTISDVIGNLKEEALGDLVTFTVSLTAIPSSNVIINFSGNDSTEATIVNPTVTFNSTNWNIPQTISLQVVDDFIFDENQTSTITGSVSSSSDASFTGAADKSVDVITEDNEVVDIIVNVLDNLTSESGDTGSFEINLTTEPLSDVFIELTSTNELEGVLSTSVISFNATNWNIPQVVIVTGVDDDPPVSDGAADYIIVTGNVSSTDDNYGLLNGSTVDDVNMSNQDNDSPGIVLTVLNDDFSTSESGDYVVVQFSLLSKPDGGESVTIPLSLDGPANEMDLSADSITILADNWDNPSSNVVTITGIDELFADGNQELILITGDPTSVSPFYDAIGADDISNPTLTNEDDDVAQVVFNLSDNVSENGTTSILSVSLTSAINTDVFLNFTVADNTELIINFTELVFTKDNWNISQEIIVTGKDDPIIDGDIGSEIIISVDDVRSDITYRTVLPTSVVVINEDNDDFDGDGVRNDLDNCPLASNYDQSDLDKDGIGDVCDDDIDGDGVLNSKESEDSTDPENNCSFKSESVTEPVTSSPDCDSDGVENSVDQDDDNDGIKDEIETDGDTDGDGIPNSIDRDSDNDGCYDVVEAGFIDQNNDGIIGDSILFVDSNGLVLNQDSYNEIPQDLNNNGIYDFLEVLDLPEILSPDQSFIEIEPGKSATLSYPYSASSYYFRWQIKRDFEDWTDLSEDIDFRGVYTPKLELTNPNKNYVGYKFRLKVEQLLSSCPVPVLTESIELVFQELFIPNSFSPNGDGINDLFVISGIDAFPDHRLIVYNRWEQKVYETKNYQNDWDGSPNMSYGDNSKLLPEGVYFYFFEESEGGKLHKGFIYIKR